MDTLEEEESEMRSDEADELVELDTCDKFGDDALKTGDEIDSFERVELELDVTCKFAELVELADGGCFSSSYSLSTSSTSVEEKF